MNVNASLPKTYLVCHTQKKCIFPSIFLPGWNLVLCVHVQQKQEKRQADRKGRNTRDKPDTSKYVKILKCERKISICVDYGKRIPPHSPTIHCQFSQFSQHCLTSLKTTQNNKAAFRAVGANHKHPLQILKELSPGLGVQKHFKQTEVNGIFAIDLS